MPAFTMRLSSVLPAALFLAVSTALPKQTQPGVASGAASAGAVSAQVKSAVASTVGQWLDDIAVVNNFVDTAGSLKDAAQISSAAATAFIAAQNEGQSNTILQQDVNLGTQGSAAAKALLAQFSIIGPAINDTISNPQNLQKNLNAINGARCPAPQGNNAINLEGAVQQAAAQAAGISAPGPAFPAACTTAAKAGAGAAANGAAAKGAAPKR